MERKKRSEKCTHCNRWPINCLSTSTLCEYSRLFAILSPSAHRILAGTTFISFSVCHLNATPRHLSAIQRSPGHISSPPNRGGIRASRSHPVRLEPYLYRVQTAFPHSFFFTIAFESRSTVNKSNLSPANFDSNPAIFSLPFVVYFVSLRTL